MAEMGKMVRQIEIKSSSDTFFQLYKAPQNVSKMSPTKIKSYEVVQGEPGTIGCVLKCAYDNNGNILSYKETISAIDHQKRLIKFKVLEGEILQLFKTFETTVECNTIGKNNVVTLTLEYQKISDENIEGPVLTVMNFFTDVTKDIDNYNLLNSAKA